MESLTIHKNRLLYIFLLVVPFFNIINYRIDPRVVLIIIISFLFFNFLFFKIKPLRKKMKSLFFILFFLLFSLISSEIYTLIVLEKSNLSYVRFFGAFIFILTYMILMYDLNIFIKKYLDKILVFYILAFSIAIIIDYIILHSTLDISLQPMYAKDAYSYQTRPFGITGQPSVNSVLLVFFYCLSLSIKSKSWILFILVTVGVVLQGSGSGFIAYLMLLVSMVKNLKYILKFTIYLLYLLVFFLILTNSGFLDKISYLYIQDMVQVFIVQTQDYLDNGINNYSDILFGGVPSGIDFGILFIIANVGLFYFLILSLFFIWLIFKADNHYDRMAIYIILIGNLHYPILFYLIMVFVLPLLIFKILYVRYPSNEFKQMGYS